VKGHKACPICGEDTFSVQLYLGTRRFLPVSHRYRKLQKAFNAEEERALKSLNCEQVYERVKHLMPSYEKVKQNIIEKMYERSN